MADPLQRAFGMALLPGASLHPVVFKPLKRKFEGICAPCAKGAAMERRRIPEMENKLVILYALRALGPVTGM